MSHRMAVSSGPSPCMRLRQPTRQLGSPVHASCPLGFGRSRKPDLAQSTEAEADLHAAPQQRRDDASWTSGPSCGSPSTSYSSPVLAHDLHASSLRALDMLKQMQSNRYAGAPKPVLLSLGLTCHSAPVSLREQLSVPEAEWPRAISELTQYPHIEEAAVLSTCNRMELYAVVRSWHPGVREVEDWLTRTSGLPLEQLRPHLFLLRGQHAAHHLLRVAAGLDSLVLGEGQILAQVRQVHKVGQSAPGFGRQLAGLFKQAVVAGKRVRTETAISAGSVSVSSAAAELAQLKLPGHSLAARRVCIIGAGKMAQLLVKHLAVKGCREVTLVNRSMARAEALAAEFPDVSFRLRLMPELLRCVEESDVVFSASGSEELLLTRLDVEAMPPRPVAATPAPPAAGAGVASAFSSALTASTSSSNVDSSGASCAGGDGIRRFIDISVPRTVCPSIGRLAGAAEVYNVDDLRQVVEATQASRSAAAAQAEVLLGEEMRAFEAWRDSLETVPTIKALRSKAEAIRACELSKALAKLGPDVSPKQRAAAEELSRAIVNKLLHGPMTALRCEGSDPETIGRTLASMSALESMFSLGEVELETGAEKAVAGGAAKSR